MIYIYKYQMLQNPDKKREFLSANGDVQDEGATIRIKRPRLDLNNTL